jgi:hypothetical protein
MIEQSRETFFSPFIYDSHLDEPGYHYYGEDLDCPIDPNPAGELVEGAPVRDPVGHHAPDFPPQVQCDELLGVRLEESDQVEDALHAPQQVHQE